jgi:putative ABC transport system permease protein
MPADLTHTPVPRIARRPPVAVAGAIALALAGLLVWLVGGGSQARDVPGPATFEATDGPHVAVFGLPGVDLEPLAGLPGLSAASGPYRTVATSLRYRGREVGVQLEGRARSESVVDHPVLVSGRWVRPGTVVLEQSTAHALRVPLGGRVTVTTAEGKESLVVGGVAKTAVRERYPGSGRGLGYILSRTMTGVAPSRTYGATMLLRLDDPDRAGKYVDWIRQRYPGAQVAVEVPSRSR